MSQPTNSEQQPEVRDLVAEYESETESPPVSGGDSKPAADDGRDRVTPPPAPSKPKHPAWLTRRAKALDIPAEEVEAADTEELKDMVLLLADSRDSTRNPSQPTPDQTSRFFDKAPNAPPGSGNTPPAPPKNAPVDLDDLQSKFESEGYDPGLAGVIKALVAEVKELRQVRETVTTLSGREAAREEQALRTTRQQVDDGFKKLGAGYHGLFGDGNYDKIKDDPRFLRMRRVVIDDLNTNPGEGSITEQVVARARELFGDRGGHTPPAKQGPVKDPETGKFVSPDHPLAAAWSAAGLGVPTDRMGAEEPPGVNKARKSVRSKLEEYDHAGSANGTPGDDESTL